MNFKTKLDEISRHEHAQKALCSLVDLIHQDMIEGKPIGYYVKEKASGVWAISKQLDALNEELNEVVNRNFHDATGWTSKEAKITYRKLLERKQHLREQLNPR